MTPPLEIFGPAWAARLGAELGASIAYRSAAARWQGSLVLELADGDGHAVFLDLDRGACREAAVAGDERRRAADFLIRADAGVWRRVLDREVDPIWGLMSGRLELARGSIGGLVPFAAAARELVAAAARVGGRLPGETIAGEGAG